MGYEGKEGGAEKGHRPEKPQPVRSEPGLVCTAPADGEKRPGDEGHHIPGFGRLFLGKNRFFADDGGPGLLEVGQIFFLVAQLPEHGPQVGDEAPSLGCPLCPDLNSRRFPVEGGGLASPVLPQPVPLDKRLLLFALPPLETFLPLRGPPCELDGLRRDIGSGKMILSPPGTEVLQVSPEGLFRVFYLLRQENPPGERSPELLALVLQPLHFLPGGETAENGIRLQDRLSFLLRRPFRPEAGNGSPDSLLLFLQPFQPGQAVVGKRMEPLQSGELPFSLDQGLPGRTGLFEKLQPGGPSFQNVQPLLLLLHGGFHG